MLLSQRCQSERVLYDCKHMTMKNQGGSEETSGEGGNGEGWNK